MRSLSLSLSLYKSSLQWRAPAASTIHHETSNMKVVIKLDRASPLAFPVMTKPTRRMTHSLTPRGAFSHQSDWRSQHFQDLIKVVLILVHQNTSRKYRSIWQLPKVECLPAAPTSTTCPWQQTTADVFGWAHHKKKRRIAVQMMRRGERECVCVWRRQSRRKDVFYL